MPSTIKRVSSESATDHPLALAALHRALPEGQVVDALGQLYPFSFDGMKLSRMPDAVVRVQEASEVGTLLQLANQYRVPVTARGGGSSLTGSATPWQGGWVLDLTALDTIEIDAEAGMAHVGAGAITGDVKAAAEEQGWIYPPDPSSVRYGTIGGNIACNAGGLSGAKYGVTRDYVLALEGFLPTGEAVSWGAKTRKFATGYNVRDLWIGSEGMLGVVTDATLKLLPKPQAKWTGLAAFESDREALLAVRALLKMGVVPAVLEFIGVDAVACAEQHTGRVIFEGRPRSAVLLIEVDGSVNAVLEESQQVQGWAKETALDFRESTDPEQTEKLWEVRRKCSPAMFQFGDSKLNEDIVVPLQGQVELMDFVTALAEEKQVRIPTFGHAADGNFHVNIMYFKEDAAQLQRAREAVGALMEKVVELGGAISGEHGVGLAKTPFLRTQYGAAELGAMQAIKQALDPNGILNPGKLFEPVEVAALPREPVKLPWDHR